MSVMFEMPVLICSVNLRLIIELAFCRVKEAEKEEKQKNRYLSAGKCIFSSSGFCSLPRRYIILLIYCCIQNASMHCIEKPVKKY